MSASKILPELRERVFPLNLAEFRKIAGANAADTLELLRYFPLVPIPVRTARLDRILFENKDGRGEVCSSFEAFAIYHTVLLYLIHGFYGEGLNGIAWMLAGKDYGTLRPSDVRRFLRHAVWKKGASPTEDELPPPRSSETPSREWLEKLKGRVVRVDGYPSAWRRPSDFGRAAARAYGKKRAQLAGRVAKAVESATWEEARKLLSDFTVEYLRSYERQIVELAAADVRLASLDDTARASLRTPADVPDALSCSHLASEKLLDDILRAREQLTEARRAVVPDPPAEDGDEFQAHPDGKRASRPSDYEMEIYALFLKQ